MDPGEIIRAVRLRRGLTQADLAARAGTTQPVISAYENGRRDPTVGTLRRLLAAAGEQLDLSSSLPPPEVPPATSPAEHADRLLDVLLFAAAVPRRTTGRRPLAFPRIKSR